MLLLFCESGKLRWKVTVESRKWKVAVVIIAHHQTRTLISSCPNKTFLEHKLKMMRNLEYMLKEPKECRRKLLLDHFEDTSDMPENSKCCDNCDSRADYEEKLKNGLIEEKKTKNYGKETMTLFKIIRHITNGRTGVGTAILFARGSSTDKLRRYNLNSPLYGSGKDKTDKFWKALSELLKHDGYLTEKTLDFGNGHRPNFGGGRSFAAFVVDLSPKGEKWVSENRNEDEPEMLLEETEDLKPPKPKTNNFYGWGYGNRGNSNYQRPGGQGADSGPTRKILHSVPRRRWRSAGALNLDGAGGSSSTEDDGGAASFELHQILQRVRGQLAQQRDIAPYMIASNKTLVHLTKLKPSSTDTMTNIVEFPVEKVRKFGDAFAQSIREFCTERNIRMDCEERNNIQFDQLPKWVKDELPLFRDAVRITYEAHLLMKMTTSELVSHRNVSENTIISYMAETIRAGMPVRLSAFSLTPNVINQIRDVVFREPINGEISFLKPIYLQLPLQLQNYNHIRLALAIFEYEHGFANNNDGETTISLPPHPMDITSAAGNASKTLDSFKFQHQNAATRDNGKKFNDEYDDHNNETNHSSSNLGNARSNNDSNSNGAPPTNQNQNATKKNILDGEDLAWMEAAMATDDLFGDNDDIDPSSDNNSHQGKNPKENDDNKSSKSVPIDPSSRRSTPDQTKTPTFGSKAGNFTGTTNSASPVKNNYAASNNHISKRSYSSGSSTSSNSVVGVDSNLNASSTSSGGSSVRSVPAWMKNLSARNNSQKPPQPKKQRSSLFKK